MENKNNNQPKKLNLMSARALQQMDLPTLNKVVDKILYEGLAILSGPPKNGKSWLVLQLAYSVVKGVPFLGHETVKSECLYLALEDGYGRLQKRLDTMLNGELIPDGLYIDIHSDRLDNGLLDQLSNVLKEKPNIKLVIIDTLQLIRGEMNRNNGVYANDYKDISVLKEFADRNHISILLVHHFRKMKDESDAFNMVSGSNGIIGAADTLFALYKKRRTDKHVVFSMTGRDIEDEELVLYPDSKTHNWCVNGTLEELEREMEKELYSYNPIVITIKKLLEESDNNYILLSSSELYNKVIEITGTRPKEKSPSALTKHMNSKLQYDLLEYDNIHYQAPSKNGGASGRKMYFCRSNRQKNIS